MHRWWRGLVSVVATTGAFALAPTVAGAAAPPAPPAQAMNAGDVTVVRAGGAVVIDELSIDAGGRLVVGVEDTRDDDPGWAVHVVVSGADRATSWKPGASSSTPSFVDSEGHRYKQRVRAHRQETVSGVATLASAPANHGLGIARVTGTLQLSPARTPLPRSIVITVV